MACICCSLLEMSILRACVLFIVIFVIVYDLVLKLARLYTLLQFKCYTGTHIMVT